MAEQVSIVETEFILREAQQRRIPVRLHGAGKTFSACVLDVRKGSILLTRGELGERKISPWESFSAYFDFRGKDMTFSSKVLKLEGDSIVLAYPEHLLRSPARRHPRVPCPKGVSLEIMLENEKVRLNYPQCGEYSDVCLPDLREGFDISTLNALIDSFRNRSSHMASESRVVLFKERGPESVEERLLARYGKILFIPSTRSPLPKEDPYPESRIITAALESEYEDSEDALGGALMDNAMISKISRAVNAEIWCPILYYQYVVGYVYMVNKADRPQAMDFSVVDCAWEFSRILAYYLKTHNYFKSEEDTHPLTHPAAIVDLSASGCLLSIPQTTLAMRVKTGAVLDLSLMLPDGTFSVRGKVVRRFEDGSGAYYGVSFLNIEERDMNRLYPTIYEVPYSPTAEEFGEARILVGRGA